MAAEYEEWRAVTKIVQNRDRRGVLIERARRMIPTSVDIHQRGREEIMLYAFDEANLRSAHRMLKSLAKSEGALLETTVSRWNPAEERWQDPELPTQPLDVPLDPEWIAVGELGWEVRITAQTRKDARKVENNLRAKGHPLTTDGLRRLLVGVAEEQEARQLAEEIGWTDRRLAIEVRPLSRWRRWRIRKAVLGGY